MGQERTFRNFQSIPQPRGVNFPLGLSEEMKRRGNMEAQAGMNIQSSATSTGPLS